MTPFLTLAGAGEAETRARASVFLALAVPVAAEEEARAVVAERERRFHDAAHHCSAWRLHGGVWRANDAGEPSGSAGAPILAAIDGGALQDCMVVVTRYYGGTKLGVGGLIRAYGEAAALALEAAPRRLAVPCARLRVRYPYPHTSAVMRALERAEAREVEHGFAAGGQEGEVSFSVPVGGAEAVAEAIRELTAGEVAAEELHRHLLYAPAP